MGLDQRHSEWIEARGISVELASKLGFTSVLKGGKMWLAMPYLADGELVNHKYRLAKDKNAMRMDAGAPLSLWNRDVISEAIDDGKPLLITEGEFDAAAAIESGYHWAVSVPNGAPKNETEDVFDATRYAWFNRDQALLDKVSKVIIAADGDEAGSALAYDLARLFGPDRCLSVKYPEGCKDLNDVLIAHGPGAVSAVINGAKEYPVRGLYRLSDYPVPPAISTVGTGLYELDEHLPLALGTWTVITGYPGAGKTSWLMWQLAKYLRKNVGIALASYETLPRPILENRMMAALVGCEEESLTDDDRAACTALMDKKLRIIGQIANDDDESMDLQKFLDLAEVAVIRDGVRMIVLDPWNELEHKRERDETETEYIGRAIRMMKSFARRLNVAFWVVAHPAKPEPNRKAPPTLYNINASANWYNKADYGVVVHRPDKREPLTEIIIPKVRMGLPGKEGKVTLEWCYRTSSYEHHKMFPSDAEYAA